MPGSPATLPIAGRAHAVVSDDLPAFCAKIVEEFAEGRHQVAHAGATGA
ncbi:MAG TPA: hypothetical protein VNY31_01120 [Solirubrobacteraceae bacterium]|nr:hypothetical protein [Solirubrobacteraceae bacterium]